MEDSVQTDFQKLSEHLTKIILANHIPAQKYGDWLCYYLKEHARINSLKFLEFPLLLFHQLQGHQNSDLKLECKYSHCIECYYEFTSICNHENFFCTCGRKITARYKTSIINNYIRIQGLRVTCVMCHNTKDKMNFSVIGVHGCQVCYECIEKRYTYQKGRSNFCPCCGTQYVLEAEVILRYTYEEKLKRENPDDCDRIMNEFYREMCYICQVIMDSRNFVQICAKNHMACKPCATQNSNNELCECGDRFSAIIN